MQYNVVGTFVHDNYYLDLYQLQLYTRGPIQAENGHELQSRPLLWIWATISNLTGQIGSRSKVIMVEDCLPSIYIFDQDHAI